MSGDESHGVGFESLLEAWMKMADQFWKTMPGVGSEASADTYGMPEQTPQKEKNRFQESLDSTRRLWSTMSSVIAEPMAADALLKGAAVLPELMMKAIGSGWEGYFRVLQQTLQRVGKIGQQTEAYTFENLDENIFNIWSDIYRKELSPLFNVPQLGLTRFYQERIGETVDKFNVFQSAFSQFLRILTLPVEKSSKVMQQKVDELAREGTLPENSQDYYRMWIKILEGHYMTLFKSPEYAQTLKETLDTLDGYLIARQQILSDMLQSLPVPTDKEMDELYRDIYELKKKVKALEKKSDGK